MCFLIHHPFLERMYFTYCYKKNGHFMCQKLKSLIPCFYVGSTSLLFIFKNDFVTFLTELPNGAASCESIGAFNWDALLLGMEALQQPLAEILANGSLGRLGSSGNVTNYIGKLGTLEGFLRQVIFYSGLIPLICFPTVIQALIARKEWWWNKTQFWNRLDL